MCARDAALRWRPPVAYMRQHRSAPGVCQVNDTHLHLGMSLRYQDLEMQDMLDQAKLEPHRCPHRDREDCLRDVIVSTASEELHTHCARGHLDNHLTNKLDGSEDHLGRGPAHSFWEELHMAAPWPATVPSVHCCSACLCTALRVERRAAAAGASAVEQRGRC